MAMVLFAGSTFAQTLFLVQEPSNLSGTYDFTDSFTADGWGADLDTTAVTAEAVFAYDDGTYVDPQAGAAGDSAACGPVVNTSEVDGKIAFIYRGSCNFSLKAYQAQAAGAVGCVIVNNVTGNLVNMLGGDSATAVVIPTVFVSDATGQALRDSINAGGVQIFLGNPNGVFTNNIGAYRSDISVANARSIPTEFAQTSTGFRYPVGSWIYNYGSADAINAVVQAVIDRDGTEVYNEVSTGATILPGDSLYVSLAEYSEDGYTPGFYTVTYTLLHDETDELPADNQITTDFWINEEGIYSKSRVSPVDGPQSIGGLRPADGTEFEWCIAFKPETTGGLAVTGLTFNLVTNDVDLTGEAVQLAVYEWNDPISSTAVSFDDLVELTDNEFYDYLEDLQGEFVTHELSEPIELIDDQQYLGCVTIFTDDVFLGVDGQVDYRIAFDEYPDEVFFPLNDIDGSTWFAAGFGAENVPAIVLNLENPNSVAEDIEKLDITPYPNPTTDVINIPLKAAVNGDVMVEVIDMKGAVVLTENICQKNSNLSMDVTGLSAGLHTFNLTFEDNSRTSFQVLIAR